VTSPVTEEILIDTGVPGVLSGTPRLGDYGTFALDDMAVAPDASGNMNIVGAREVTMALYYVDELATDLWASIDAAIDDDGDPVTVACTVNPATSRVFRVGDFVVFNDETADGIIEPPLLRVRADHRARRHGDVVRPATSPSSVRIPARPPAVRHSRHCCALTWPASASTNLTGRRSPSA
jgi:hypothetical protein